MSALLAPPWGSSPPCAPTPTVRSNFGVAGEACAMGASRTSAGGMSARLAAGWHVAAWQCSRCRLVAVAQRSSSNLKKKGGHHREGGGEDGQEVGAEGFDDAGHVSLLVLLGWKMAAGVVLGGVSTGCVGAACGGLGVRGSALALANLAVVHRRRCLSCRAPCRFQSAKGAGRCLIQVMSACGARPERPANYSRRVRPEQEPKQVPRGGDLRQ